MQPRGHLADLVEQQRAAVGLGQKPLTLMNGTRERAARVTKDLALQQLLRNGRGVHGDERRAPPLASRVDCVRDQLLAHTRLPDDEHGGARASHEVDGRLQSAHRRPAPDELRLARRGRCGGKTSRLARVPAAVDRLRHDLPQGVRIERLDQVFERAALDRVHRLRDAARSRDHDERQRGVGLSDAIEQLEPVHAIHPDVADHDVESLALGDLQSLGGACSELAAVTVRRENQLERLAHLGVVVHDEHPRLHRARG